MVHFGSSLRLRAAEGPGHTTSYVALQRFVQPSCHPVSKSVGSTVNLGFIPSVDSDSLTQL